MNDSQFDMLFTIMVIVIVVGTVSVIFKSINEKLLNSKAPVLEIPVKVVDKRVQARKGSEDHYNVFKVTFEDLDTNERHTFKLSESKFDKIAQDDIGYLNYQRKRFHSFQRDKLAAEFEQEATKKSDMQFKIEE
ncbi:MAG: DUF2500 domain-containing protein [Kordia sp.]|uniref:DUF2500 domain-containing protein n=1 Tax=Kordia sp. TaxID=1965332 RepID=UPI0038586480